MREREIIKKNLASTKDLNKALSVIIRSQLLEASECLRGKSPSKAKDFFEYTFQKSALCGEMLELSTLICKSSPSTEEKVRERVTVSCSKNPLSISAAKHMCNRSRETVIDEQTDFRSVCEAVASNDSDYAVLPMCSSFDGYYPTFSKLVKAYDLKICSTCRFSKEDSDEELTFALLSRTLEIQKDPKTIAFSFVCDETVLLPALIGALNDCGCIAKSIISAPLEYNTDIFEHRVEADLAGISPEAILFFLDATLPRHAVLGIY